MAKGRKTGGRKKGTPNVLTQDVRAAIGLFAQRNVDKLESWLNRTARRNPAKAADIMLRALEYHVPKLGRMEVAGLVPNVGPGLTILIQQGGEQRAVMGGAGHVVVNLPAPA